LARARALGIDVRFDSGVVGVEVAADAVRLRFSDGGSQNADVLVAADGLRSRVRELVFPEYPKPHFTGLVATAESPRPTFPIRVA